MHLPLLNKRFREPASYQRPDRGYLLLPFRFLRLDSGCYLVTNLVGEYVVLPAATLGDLVERQLTRSSEYFDELRAKHFIAETSDDVALDLLATKYRTKQASLAEFTSLHIFVVTLRCDHSCPYCQVSRVSEDREAYDMSASVATQAINLALHSPSRNLKIEFQGGESLLNFDRIRHIVHDVEERAGVDYDNVEFVIATNLAPLTEAMLEFCAEHSILLSTSLDGPRALHNANRPRPDNDSYELTIAGIRRARDRLGLHAVSALMTTTKRSLDQVEPIIDEYVAQGFGSIFLRWLSPYGFAVRSSKALGYSSEAFKQFYKRGLNYILDLNRAGLEFREEYASILLQKILTPYDTGYVDLQSPAGLGRSVLVYNYDGGVYASDEARMLAEVDDFTFRLGTVEDSYQELLCSSGLRELLATTMTEATPMCAECACEPFCGTDPLFHYATQGDTCGHRPTSAFCDRNMSIIKLLIDLLENDSSARDILESWV